MAGGACPQPRTKLAGLAPGARHRHCTVQEVGPRAEEHGQARQTCSATRRRGDPCRISPAARSNAKLENEDDSDRGTAAIATSPPAGSGINDTALGEPAASAGTSPGSPEEQHGARRAARSLRAGGPGRTRPAARSRRQSVTPQGQVNRRPKGPAQSAGARDGSRNQQHGASSATRQSTTTRKTLQAARRLRSNTVSQSAEIQVGSRDRFCQSVSQGAAGDAKPAGPAGDSRHKIPSLTGFIRSTRVGPASTVLIIQDRANARVTSWIFRRSKTIASGFRGNSSRICLPVLFFHVSHRWNNFAASCFGDSVIVRCVPCLHNENFMVPCEQLTFF